MHRFVYKCPVIGCKLVCAQFNDLVEHERTHSGEKPHLCEHIGCNWAFAQRSALIRHVRVHSGERPYTCGFAGCDWSFASSYARQVHIRTHTGHKPFTCDHCDMTFARSDTLAKHVHIHSPGYAQRKKREEMRVSAALVHAGYVECVSLGDAAPPRGHFCREKCLRFDGCGGMATEKASCRIDFVVYSFKGALVFIEVDEAQHFDQPTLCEASRMTNAYGSMLVGGSPLVACTWLRYNPHEYIDRHNNIVCMPAPKAREAWLVQFLNDDRLCALRGLRVLYAYYDSVELCELGEVVPARALEFDYNAHLRSVSFDAHLHAFDTPRWIDDETAEVAVEAIETHVEAREARARARLTKAKRKREV